MEAQIDLYYPEEVIERVRDANDIVEVIGQYVQLKKKGGTYFGLCPFHGEKTPSFSVSPAKQMYYCFGCGAGGNVFTFLMEYENYSFSEALKYLAQRANISLPESSGPSDGGYNAGLKEKLLEIHKKAAVFYHEKLKSEKGMQGLEYFKGKRGLSDRTIVHFGLGYSGKNSSELYNYLRSEGYDDNILSETGLVVIEERGAHDRFWNRVMFPIMDVNNRVVGFGGRVMGDGEPKYLNSPETKIFDKSKNLYGLNYARKSRKDHILLCEGYMDVIALHQYGFTNAVASLGTAFNEKHARLLKRYTNKVILTQDSDEAGIRAKLRALPILKEAGISARVLDMSPYKDPDEFLKALGPEAFNDRIMNAKNAFMYEIDILKRGYDLTDPEGKTDFYNAVAEKLCGFTEALERDNYTQTVAKEHFIPYEALKRLVNQKGLTKGLTPSTGMNPARTHEQGLRNAKPKGDTGLLKSERILLTGICERPEIYQSIKGLVEPEDFSDDLYKELAYAIFEGCEKGNLKTAALIDKYSSDEDTRKRVAAILNAKPFMAKELSESEDSEDDEDGSMHKSTEDALKRIRLNALEKKMEKAVESGDAALLQRLIEEKNGII